MSRFRSDLVKWRWRSHFGNMAIRSFANLTFTLLTGAIFMTAAPTIAEETSIEQSFAAVVAKAPKFALGLAYDAGDGDIQTMVAGPQGKKLATAVPVDARWHIGSISKSFTSTLVMQLVEQGVLDLDAPVSRYLPDDAAQMDAGWAGSTLRQLLSHTAGLPANAPIRILLQEQDDSPRAARQSVLSQLWHKETGDAGEFLYSNLGYVLAAYVVEQVTDTAWEDLIITRIAQPLGLSSLGFGAPSGVGDPLGHKSIFGFKSSVQPTAGGADNPAWMAPAGGLHMTLQDLVAWGQAHLAACDGARPELMGQAMCKLQKTVVKDGYGLGWVVMPSDDHGPFVWHNGSNTMWYAVLTLLPERGQVYAIATNVMAAGRVDELAKSLPDLLQRR